MASAKNRVIAGDYAGKQVLSTFGMVQIATSLTKGIPINKTTIEGYELITDEHRKSAASGVARGLVGGGFAWPGWVACWWAICEKQRNIPSCCSIQRWKP